jgi:uncharacterized protein YcaQ
VELSKGDAREFLTRYHFTPGSLQQVFFRLGSIQYDPLKPLGRNVDLVLQSRVPDYRIGDWEPIAYKQRLVIDCWDKQACLALASDWPYRYLYHEDFRKRWHDRIFAQQSKMVVATLRELRSRGPLTTLDFSDQRSVSQWHGSWYGPKLVKNVLRALWDSGQVATHHRVAGRHAYHLVEEVVREKYRSAPKPTSSEALRFLIQRRVQSAGLLRTGAGSSLWSLPTTKDERTDHVRAMVADGDLHCVMVDGVKYLAQPNPSIVLDDYRSRPRMTFVGALDNFVWDRRSLKHLFSFDYIWEVYKPKEKRRWGYYVLPVLYGDRFVARMDGRCTDGHWNIFSWYWEDDEDCSASVLCALEDTVASFASYLRADYITLPSTMCARTKQAFRTGFGRREA